MQSPNRVLLNVGFDTREVYTVGSWFRVLEAAVYRVDSGTYFAPARAEESRSGRRVIQGSPYGPNMVFFARSATIASDYRHEAHDHRLDFRSCRIDRDGWVALSVPVNVASGELSYGNWSCPEPDTSGLQTEIERRLQL